MFETIFNHFHSSYFLIISSAFESYAAVCMLVISAIIIMMESLSYSFARSSNSIITK